MKSLWQRIKHWFAESTEDHRLEFPRRTVDSGVASAGADNENDNCQLVADELSALLRRTNADAFVIIEEARSGKFVQFAGRAGDPLWLDLPSQTLSEAEFERAVRYFRLHGQESQEYDLLDEPGGVPVNRQVSFQMSLGDDVQRAAQITLEIFLQVFQFPKDIVLRIERN